MNLFKKAEDASTITLGWAKVPGATGYRFTAQNQANASHSWNPDRDQVIFAKGSSWYKVEALGVLEFDTYPDAPPPPPPPPPPDPDAAKILQRLSDCTRVWNKTQAQYPGQQAQEPLSTGPAWPNGGGIFEVPRGFKLVLTPEMIYPGPADSRLVRVAWGDPFNPYGDRWLTGKTTRIEWVDIFPGGQNFEDDHTAPALWEFPVGPSVGHNFTRQGDGRFRFQRQNAPGKSWAVYTGPPATWDQEHRHAFECYWTLESNGYITLETNGQEWVNYRGPTIMATSEPPWVTYWHMRAALDPSRINTRFLLDWSLSLVTASSFAAQERKEEDLYPPVDVVTEAYPGWKDNSENERKEKLPKPPKQ